MTGGAATDGPAFNPWEEVDERYKVVLDGRNVAENVSRRVAETVILQWTVSAESIPGSLVRSRSRNRCPMHYSKVIPGSLDLSLDIEVTDGEVLARSPFVKSNDGRTCDIDLRG